MDTASIRLDFLHPAGGTPARARWYRVVARRLARALGGANPGEMAAAGALAAAVVEHEASGAAAVRRAAALLDAVLLGAGDEVGEEARAALEQRVEAWLASGGARDARAVAAELREALRAVGCGTTPRCAGTSLDVAVAEFLAEHLHEGVRLTDLARRLGYSASHCSALIRHATGERFSVLRRRLQLERALALLRSGTSVKAAALGAGFSEPAYFSRVFTRRYGVPPSRWREVVERADGRPGH